MKVEDIMTHPVFSCSPQDSLERAAQLMWDHDCGCLPVVSDELRDAIEGPQIARTLATICSPRHAQAAE